MECSENMKTVYLDENNVVLNENSVEIKPSMNRESKSDELTIKLCSCHDINIKFLVVVKTLSIYHSCSTRKTFWEENFTGKKDLFQYANMKNCGSCKVRKHKEIKGSDKIVTLNVSAKFDSEDVVFILFRLSNFAEIFKLTILLLPLISLCFLTL